jgi:flagellar FliL protein
VAADNKEAQEAITHYMPVIRDGILTMLSSKTVADLDVRNRNNLKSEIINDLNAKIGSGLIKNIYFTSFVMQ